MSLPWNRRAAHDDDDSWLTRIPVVGRLSSATQSRVTADRSVPRRVADAPAEQDDRSLAPADPELSPASDGAERPPDEQEATARP